LECLPKLLALSASEIRSAITKLLDFRGILVNEKGYIGVLPEIARKGDVVALLRGGDVLYILGPSEEEGCCELIGDCYVHGLMDGEVLNGKGQADEDFEIITLV
jgi:hypothetical protein